MSKIRRRVDGSIIEPKEKDDVKKYLYSKYKKNSFPPNYIVSIVYNNSTVTFKANYGCKTEQEIIDALRSIHIEARRIKLKKI